MEEEQPQRLFTKGFTRRIREAIKLNANGNPAVYYHPREKAIVPKCVDLSCPKPLHRYKPGDLHPTNPSPERWLEAYLIQQARRDNWAFELCGNRYRLLFSQLKFRRDTEDGPRPLDLLIWKMQTRHLTVLELKAGRKRGRRLNESLEELDYYTERVNSHKHELAEVFELGEVLGVEGYVIWPENPQAKCDLDAFGKYGVVEYEPEDQPWKVFREGNTRFAMEFHLRRPWSGST